MRPSHRPSWPVVWLVDPGSHVAAYDESLAAALVEAGCAVVLHAAPARGGGHAPSASDQARLPMLPSLVRRAAPGGIGRPPGALPLWRRRLAGACRGAWYPAEVLGLVGRARRERPDIVHLQWTLVPPVEWLAVRALKRLRIAVVVTVHNVIGHDGCRAPRVVRFAPHRAADRLVVHSRATARRLADLGAIDPLRLAVVPMAAEPPIGHRFGREEARTRLGLRLPPEASLVLFFGQDRPYKGLGVLTAAVDDASRARSAVHLLVAGPAASGPGQPPSSRAAGRPATADDRVIRRPGFRPPEEVSLLMAACDLVALPYVDTDDSAVLSLALAHGRAVIATEVGGLPEALQRGGGLLVPPRDRGALCAAILRVVGDASLRERLEREAAASAAAWTWSDAGRATRDVYERVLRQDGRRG